MQAARPRRRARATLAALFEIILIIAATVAIWCLAENQGEPGLKWGGITLGLCLLSILIPLPFLRVILAIGIALVLMTVMKKTVY